MASVIPFGAIEGFSKGRGQLVENVAHFENVGIQPGDGVWASVTEVDPSTGVAINGDAYITAQQVAWSPLEGGVVDVSVWVDNVPNPVHWRCSLFLSR
jgi:hypothetical protein